MVSIGRAGDLVIGGDPPDAGLSGLAITVRPEPGGWALRLANRNGQVVHRWAAAREQVHAASERLVAWPRVGVLVNGIERDREHWVLLETDRYACGVSASSAAAVGDTVARARPTDLTLLQRATVETLFSEYLSWPPIAAPATRSLAAVRTRLGVGSDSAIQERLKPVRARAETLGLRADVGLTDPDYLFVLAEHGYFPVPGALGNAD
jgi:hypothetical protein